MLCEAVGRDVQSLAAKGAELVFPAAILCNGHGGPAHRTGEFLCHLPSPMPKSIVSRRRQPGHGIDIWNRHYIDGRMDSTILLSGMTSRPRPEVLVIKPVDSLHQRHRRLRDVV